MTYRGFCRASCQAQEGGPHRLRGSLDAQEFDAVLSLLEMVGLMDLDVGLKGENVDKDAGFS